MFSKVLVANRGEIARRVFRTLRELGVGAVAVHSDVDAGARHVIEADEAVHLPGVVPADTYLNVPAIVEAARRTGAEAIHPGYGFFSERADAARAVRDAGLVWVGPPPEVLEAVGDKLRARRLAAGAGVAPVPGTLEPVAGPDAVLAFAAEHGYPVAVKAAAGGGGKGLRVAWSDRDVEDALAGAAREAGAYFGDRAVYLERYLPAPKHLEVQVLAEEGGRAVAIGVRECSMQRRHQKLVEETPPPRHAHLIEAISDAAVAVAGACGYVNAGTVEFLVDEDDGFFFLEVNARLQVEHTVTEAVTGLDLVAEQLRISSGEWSPPEPPPRPRGHAIECRINAEDPARGFLPSPGQIVGYREPAGPGVRVDSGYVEGDVVPEAYDGLMAKLVVHGADREEARRRALDALAAFEIEGVATTIPAHLALLEHPAFVDGSYTTRTVEDGALEPLERAAAERALLVEGRPAHLWHPAVARFVGGAAAGGGTVVAPMHGTILSVLVKVGDEVAAGDPIAVLEAMKMETHIAASVPGTVRAVHVEQGGVVESGQPVAEVS